MKIKFIATSCGCAAMMVIGTSFASTAQAEIPLVTLVAGQTIEIPLLTNRPISGNLTARGAFKSGDVIFTPGPKCYLSASGCTLLITASPASRNYTAVPVTISEFFAGSIPAFKLSVIHTGQSKSISVKLPTNYPISRSAPYQPYAANTLATTNRTQYAKSTNLLRTSLLRSGNALFYGEVEPHSRLIAAGEETGSKFTAATNGPVYQIVTLTNNDVAQALSVEITGAGANSFNIDNETSHYGANQSCTTIGTIASGDSCLVIVKGEVGDPRQAPKTATLTITGNNNNAATFNLTATTYVYVAGGFNALGNASVSGGDLLAQCTAGTCSNALQGTTGNNYASTNFSVGQWINALAVTSSGNLLVGGVFGAIGGATSGATSGTAALLAQCTPGSVDGNACINQISGTSPYVSSNAYINAITAPFAISGTNYIVVGGDFNKIKTTSVVSGGRMLAKCQYNETSSSSICSNYLSSATTKYANNAISALSYLNGQINVGGMFTQIAGYPGSAPSSGTTFASCSSSNCSNGMDSNNPNSSILGMTNDGTNLYMGGVFTQIGGYIDGNGGYPLVMCVPGSLTTCSNALAGTMDANNYIQGVAYSAGSLYVGGKFTTIGGATPVSGGDMLAICAPGGTCSNFVTDSNPYASGTDWGGNIAAIAIGSQTTITAN